MGKTWTRLHRRKNIKKGCYQPSHKKYYMM